MKIPYRSPLIIHPKTVVEGGILQALHAVLREWIAANQECRDVYGTQ